MLRSASCVSPEFPLITFIYDHEYRRIGVLVDANTIPCFPPSFEPSPHSLHCHPIVPPSVHLPFKVNLAPQASHRPSPRSPRDRTLTVHTAAPARRMQPRPHSARNHARTAHATACPPKPQHDYTINMPAHEPALRLFSLLSQVRAFGVSGSLVGKQKRKSMAKEDENTTGNWCWPHEGFPNLYTRLYPVNYLFKASYFM